MTIRLHCIIDTNIREGKQGLNDELFSVPIISD